MKKETTPTMPTVNSLSGGKTSSYIAKHYPADYNVFALVRTTDKKCIYPDKKIRQIVSDKIGCEFIGTLEEDIIIHTMLDLEQFIGTKIDWVTGKPFDDIMKRKSEKFDKIATYVPNAMRRFCTSEMKVIPISQWWYDEIKIPVEMRIGFRANEMRRAKTMIEKTNENNLTTEKIQIGKHANGNKKWKTFEWRTPTFPLIDDGIYKDTIEKYWHGKPVRFAYMNNCIGCFHRVPILLKHMSTRHPEKFDWFIRQENESMKYYSKSTRFRQDTTYEQIKNHKSQMELFDTDFNECDSGYCGL